MNSSPTSKDSEPTTHSISPLDSSWRAYWETTARLLDQLEQGLKNSVELRLSDYNLLMLLNEAEDHQLKMGELAEAMVFSPSRLTYQVSTLEKRGLIVRTQCPLDARSFQAQLTEDGITLFRKAAVIHSRQVQELFTQYLSPEEHDLLYQLFTKVGNNLPR